MDKLYVITAVHNRRGTTSKFIGSLTKQTFRDFQLILVDDGSTDGTDEMVKDSLPNSIILYGDGGLWWGGALHRAYQYIKAGNFDPDDGVLIANDDNIIHEDFLQKGVDLLRGNPNTLIPAIGYSLDDGKLRDGAVYWNFKTGENYVLEPGASGNCASTRALFFRVRDFLKVGGFHPRLLPHYGSDYEFAIRAWKKGFEIKTFSDLAYVFDAKTTGDRAYTKYGTKELLKRAFSKRSSYNPIYKLNLLILVTPLRFLPSAMYYQTRKAIGKRKSGV